MTALLKLPGLGRCAFKIRKGNQRQAIDYTRKGEQTKKEWKAKGVNGVNFGKNADWIEFGIPTQKQQGKRSDLDGIYDLVVEGKTDAQIIDDVGFGAFNRCYKAIDKVRLQHRPSWERKREIILIHGDTGIGKTRWAYINYPDLYEMPLQSNTMWFDGYAGEETVLLDDFSGEMILTQLLKLLDIYLRKVPVKGSQVWMTAKRFIVSTNKHPSDWYQWVGRENQEEALKRRFVDYGYFMAWTTLSNGKNGLGEVDPDDFWPVAPTVVNRKVYLARGQIRCINEVMMPPQQTKITSHYDQKVAEIMKISSDDSSEEIGYMFGNEYMKKLSKLFVHVPPSKYITANTPLWSLKL